MRMIIIVNIIIITVVVTITILDDAAGEVGVSNRLSLELPAAFT